MSMKENHVTLHYGCIHQLYFIPVSSRLMLERHVLFFFSFRQRHIVDVSWGHPVARTNEMTDPSIDHSRHSPPRVKHALVIQLDEIRLAWVECLSFFTKAKGNPMMIVTTIMFLFISWLGASFHERGKRSSWRQSSFLV
jgi:hypothetical protein